MTNFNFDQAITVLQFYKWSLHAFLDELKKNINPNLDLKLNPNLDPNLVHNQIADSWKADVVLGEELSFLGAVNIQKYQMNTWLECEICLENKWENHKSPCGHT